MGCKLDNVTTQRNHPRVFSRSPCSHKFEVCMKIKPDEIKVEGKMG